MHAPALPHLQAQPGLCMTSRIQQSIMERVAQCAIYTTLGNLQSVISQMHGMQAANGGGDFHDVEDAAVDLQVGSRLHVRVDLLAGNA